MFSSEWTYFSNYLETSVYIANKTMFSSEWIFFLIT